MQLFTNLGIFFELAGQSRAGAINSTRWHIAIIVYILQVHSLTARSLSREYREGLGLKVRDKSVHAVQDSDDSGNGSAKSEDPNTVSQRHLQLQLAKWNHLLYDWSTTRHIIIIVAMTIYNKLLNQ